VDIERAIELIDQAKKPVVLAGGGVWWAQAQDDLKAFNFMLDVKKFPDSLKLVRVDIESSALCDGRIPDVGIAGDAGVVLRQLTQAVKQKERAEWIDLLQTTCEKAAQMMTPLATSSHVPIHPLRLMHEVSLFVDRDTVVVAGGGAADVLSENYPVKVQRLGIPDRFGEVIVEDKYIFDKYGFGPDHIMAACKKISGSK